VCSPTAARLVWLALAGAARLGALEPADVLLIGNSNSPASKVIAEHYARIRHLAAAQTLMLQAPDQEEIPREVYVRQIAEPVGRYLHARGWVERILVLVTTSGVPLKIRGSEGLSGDAASVDSELAALYQDLHGRPHSLRGPHGNPYYGKSVPFRHPDFPLYLVTRLTGFSTPDAAALVGRAVAARNRGVFVIDLRDSGYDEGDLWLKSAANRLPRERVVIDETTTVLRAIGDVIGYASWGSNDKAHRERDLGLKFLPGALATEFVSSNARTFQAPPLGWKLGEWKQRGSYFAGSPQSLTGDLVHQGASGVSGHVYEPYLEFNPRPQILFPSYLAGLTLAESFYAAMPAISWMNVIVGDPLCRLGPG
jgi:uncharacterized protein (TIGR03790 family)